MKSVKNGSSLGFTIVEVMVAMVVLAIGLLGMAGITLMVIKGGTDASRMTYATNLAADKMESLKDVTWDDLGSATTCDDSTEAALVSGCSGQAILIEPELNEQGQTPTDTGAVGPFSFIRKTVVCINGSELPLNTLDRCINNTASVPTELTCNAGSTEVASTDEKKIKILVGWRDKTGRCHKVDMTSVQVNLGS